MPFSTTFPAWGASSGACSWRETRVSGPRGPSSRCSYRPPWRSVARSPATELREGAHRESGWDSCQTQVAMVLCTLNKILNAQKFLSLPPSALYGKTNSTRRVCWACSIIHIMLERHVWTAQSIDPCDAATCAALWGAITKCALYQRLNRWENSHLLLRAAICMHCELL